MVAPCGHQPARRGGRDVNTTTQHTALRPQNSPLYIQLSFAPPGASSVATSGPIQRWVGLHLHPTLAHTPRWLLHAATSDMRHVTCACGNSTQRAADSCRRTAHPTHASRHIAPHRRPECMPWQARTAAALLGGVEVRRLGWLLTGLCREAPDHGRFHSNGQTRTIVKGQASQQSVIAAAVATHASNERGACQRVVRCTQ